MLKINPRSCALPALYGICFGLRVDEPAETPVRRTGVEPKRFLEGKGSMMALLARARHIGTSMSWCRRDPTITEIMSDSIIKALMKADRIDPEALDAQLRSMARELSNSGAR